jgi:hypothetical protein
LQSTGKEIETDTEAIKRVIFKEGCIGLWGPLTKDSQVKLYHSLTNCLCTFRVWTRYHHALLRESHLSCSCCCNRAQSMLLPWWPGLLSVLISWSELCYPAVGGNDWGSYCVQAWLNMWVQAVLCDHLNRISILSNVHLPELPQNAI